MTRASLLNLQVAKDHHLKIAKKVSPELSTSAVQVSYDLDCVPNADTICFKFTDYSFKSQQKPAPAPFAEKNCPGLDSCDLNVTQYSYKQHIQFHDQEPQVISHEHELSPQVPYLSWEFDDFHFNSPQDAPIYNGTLSHCYKSWITTEDDTRLYVKQCTVLVDMSLGDPDMPKCELTP